MSRRLIKSMPSGSFLMLLLFVAICILLPFGHRGGHR